MHAVQGGMRQPASAIVLRFAKTAVKSKADQIRLTLSALEATLPDGDVQLHGTWIDARTFEAVYTWPSQAIYVVQGLQDAVRRTRFRGAVAFGAHWSDVIHVQGVAVAPHALTVARALSDRIQPRDPVWLAFQGYGAWDQIATAALSVTCNVRNERSTWQRDAEAAFRQGGTMSDVAEALGVIPRTATLRLRRGHVRQVEHLDVVLCRQLDAAAASL